MKTINIIETAQYLRSCDNFLILTHINPDGDTLGSGFGLMHALRSIGKKAKVICSDDIPAKFNYMAQYNDINTDFNADTVVAVDVADIKLLGKDFEVKFANKIDLCIDHHISNMNYSDKLLLRECAATCEIIYDLIKAMEIVITPLIADCLYTGISTDSGCFMYSNVTPKTHRIAADLIEYGADYVEINKVMFETKPMSYFKLERLILNSVETYFNGKCAVITITQDMFIKSGSDESQCDGIASLPRKIEGVVAGVTIRERKDGTFKVSLRSHAPIDSASICAKMGGGGHARAAGFEIEAETFDQQKNQLLNIIETELKTS